jgi:dCMP deaminase
MAMCDCVASKSKDISTKVGCVIMGADMEIRSTGYNGFPRGAKDTEPCTCLSVDDGFKIPQLSLEREAAVIRSRYERPLKYKWTEHAERNAIYNAARVGIPLKGCTIYINSLPPCSDCARAIIQSGISAVVFMEGDVPERWLDDCNMACEMLWECGVTVMTMKQKEVA